MARSRLVGWTIPTSAWHPPQRVTGSHKRTVHIPWIFNEYLYIYNIITLYSIYIYCTYIYMYCTYIYNVHIYIFCMYIYICIFYRQVMYLAFVFLGDTSHEVIQFGAPATREMCPCCRDLWGLLILHWCVQKYLIYVLVYIYTRYPKLLSHPTLHIWVRNVCCAPSSNICYISWSPRVQMLVFGSTLFDEAMESCEPRAQHPIIADKGLISNRSWFHGLISWVWMDWKSHPIFIHLQYIYIYML